MSVRLNPEKNTRGRLRNLFEHDDLTYDSHPEQRDCLRPLAGRICPFKNQILRKRGSE